RSGVSRFRTHAVRPENPGSVVAAASTWSPTLIARPAYACASRLRRKRAHDRVDDLVRVLVVERRAAEEEAVEQRSDEHLMCESPGWVGTEVAARDAAVDDRLYLCEPEIDDSFTVRAAQMRLRGNGRSELSDDAAGLDDPLRRSYEGQQLLARVADVGRRGDLRRRVDEDRERELLLVPPAPVDRRLRHA